MVNKRLSSRTMFSVCTLRHEQRCFLFLLLLCCILHIRFAFAQSALFAYVYQSQHNADIPLPLSLLSSSYDYNDSQLLVYSSFTEAFTETQLRMQQLVNNRSLLHNTSSSFTNDSSIDADAVVIDAYIVLSTDVDLQSGEEWLYGTREIDNTLHNVHLHVICDRSSLLLLFNGSSYSSVIAHSLSTMNNSDRCTMQLSDQLFMVSSTAANDLTDDIGDYHLIIDS